MKNLLRLLQAHFLGASAPDPSPPDRFARACGPKSEPARRLKVAANKRFLDIIFYHRGYGHYRVTTGVRQVQLIPDMRPLTSYRVSPCQKRKLP